MYGSRIQVDPITGASSHRLMSYSTHRSRLRVWPPLVGTATLSNEPNVVPGSGIVLQIGMPPVDLHFRHDGDIVWHEWYVVYGGGGGPVAFVETMSPT